MAMNTPTCARDCGVRTVRTHNWVAVQVQISTETGATSGEVLDPAETSVRRFMLDKVHSLSQRQLQSETLSWDKPAISRYNVDLLI